MKKIMYDTVISPTVVIGVPDIVLLCSFLNCYQSMGRVTIGITIERRAKTNPAKSGYCHIYMMYISSISQMYFRFKSSIYQVDVSNIFQLWLRYRYISSI